MPDQKTEDRGQRSEVGMLTRHVICFLFSVFSPLALASALEFRSIKETGTVLYAAPSLNAKKLFVVSRFYPVEILSTQSHWSRIRDATGAISWVPSVALSLQHMLLVLVSHAQVYQSPTPHASLAFSVEKDGVVRLIAPPKNGWAYIEHPDGAKGYARLSDFWGL